jgi:hypothetical protein
MPARTVLFAAAAAVVLVVSAASPARAQTPPPAQNSPEALAREAIDKLMQALSMAIQNLPQYEMPRLNERGDIIIRRINPPPPKKPGQRPLADDEDRT